MRVPNLENLIREAEERCEEVIVYYNKDASLYYVDQTMAEIMLSNKHSKRHLKRASPHIRKSGSRSRD